MYQSLYTMGVREREEGIQKLKRIYEKKVKIGRIMKLDIPQAAKIRAQQEVENSEIQDMTLEDRKKCTIEEVYENMLPYFDYASIAPNLNTENSEPSVIRELETYEVSKKKLRELAETLVDNYDDKTIFEFMDENIPKSLKSFYLQRRNQVRCRNYFE